MNLKSCRSFTIVEILIAVVLVGVMAAFAMPSYNKAVNKSMAQDAVNNLKALCAAQMAYKDEMGDFYPDFGLGIADTAELNQALGLSIMETNGITYRCNTALGDNCQANRAGHWRYVWTLGSTCAVAGSVVCMPLGGYPCPTVK